MHRFAKRLASASLALLVALVAGGTASALPAGAVVALADEASQAYSADQAPELSAQAAYLYDRTTGTVLLDKNADERHYPASMTKIMTALITLEHANLTDEVTVEQSDLDMITVDSSNAGLKAGEKTTVENLLACLLLPSANESAYTLARHVAGDYQSFVNMMNDKAAELGCTGTHFVNPCGLHDDDHYTTAHDMALILTAASQNADFVRISGSATWDLPETNMNPARTIKNTNLLVNAESSLHLEGVTCGKTGYTGDAGRCLAAGAFKDGLDVVGVVMAAPESEGSAAAISNMHDLLSWGLSAWQTTSIVNAGDVLGASAVRLSKDGEKLNVSAADAIVATLPAGTTEDDLDVAFSWQGPLTAPVEAGEPLGTAAVSFQGRELATIGAVAAFGMRLSIPAFVMDWLSDPIHMVIVVVALVALFVLVGLLASRGSRRRQRDLRREHDRRRAQAAGRRVGAHYATPRKKR
ncbi:D-alanyl-D-alanine carboxypeptidase family protein [Paratractidigestivibacter faecalis]|uniref:D-alanyl-D-alanine carboxypeptidase family protein n=1 Tax=Paratractidigestivibacter faecalis TaxID=2292441 RepID=UPI003AB48927